jgi:pantetheine-phosphate adenylyltransferase
MPNHFTRVTFPGSFDPITNGHLDLIERGARIFNELVVSVLRNPDKDPLFSLPERVAIIQEVTAAHPNVSVDSFDGLLVEHARRIGANTILRGIRAISDYEYELQMALMNRRLAPEVETVFMMPAQRYTFLSSRLVKEVFLLGGKIEDLVPAIVLERLRAKIPVP